MDANPTVENLRKRPLEALERRLAAAKVQLLQQHKRQKWMLDDSDKKKVKDVNFPIQKDTEENDPIYSELSLPVNEKLLTANNQFSSKKTSSVDKLLDDLLQNGDSGRKYIQGSRSTKKFDNWILLDNLVPKTRASYAASNMKAVRKESKRSKMHMSMKELKKSGALDLPNDFRNFDLFMPMHAMWEDYARQLIKATGKNQLAQTLLSSDLHGAYMLVADCKITSLIGVNGIMVRETAETFGIISRCNKFRVVPKKLSIFIIQIDCWKITLQGGKLESRNSILSF